MALMLNILFFLTPIIIIAIGRRLYYTNNKESFNHFTIWLTLTVMVALAPLITNSMYLIMRGIDPTLTAILARGELFIISVAIVCDGLGRILATFELAPAYKPAKILCATLGILMIMISSSLFTLSSFPSGESLNSTRVALMSGIIFLVTTIMSALTLFLSEAKK